MGDVHYLISETAKRVGVESHALRHWEEELSLPIGRTEMGHRYYTEEDIQLFCCIKELKEQGVLLKEIKEILPDILHTKEQLRQKHSADLLAPNLSEISVQSADSPGMLEFQEFLGSTLQSVLTQNNKILEENISRNVSREVTKELDMLLTAKERLEEDRYRKLDHLIRQQQVIRKENSKPSPGHYLKKLLGES